ncbi:hypothetical protein CF319_g3511 [Tilletia indica]|nr:hypothetical protein CF319_g3511 [Tilletia indica]
MTGSELASSAVLGLTPDQFIEYGYFRVYKAVAYTLLGWFIWEYILTFSVELDVLTRKRPLRLHLLPYFITRYACLGATISNIILIYSSSELNCTAVISTLIIMSATCQMMSQVMFSLRALALWNYDRIVATCLSIVWIPHAAMSYMVVIGFQTRWVNEPVSQTGFCAVSQYSPYAVPSYSLLLSVDIIVSVFILIRLFALRDTARSKFTDLLARDLLLYLLCCVIPTIAGIVVVLTEHSISLRSAFYVITTQAHTVFSCRAFINTSQLAKQLPAHLQLRVHNEHLDPDTLRRIAGHLGMQADLSGNEDQSRLPRSMSDVDQKENSRGRPWTILKHGFHPFKTWRSGTCGQKESAPPESASTKYCPGSTDRPAPIWERSARVSPISIESSSSTQRPFNFDDASRKGSPKFRTQPGRSQQPSMSISKEQKRGFQSYFPPTGTCKSLEGRFSPSLAGKTESMCDSLYSFAETGVAFTPEGTLDNTSLRDSEILVVAPQDDVCPGLTTSRPSSICASDSTIVRQTSAGLRPDERRPAPFRSTSARWSYGRSTNPTRGWTWDSRQSRSPVDGGADGSDSDSGIWQTCTVPLPAPNRVQVGRSHSPEATMRPSASFRRTSSSQLEASFSQSTTPPSLPASTAPLRVVTTVETQIREDFDADYPAILSSSQGRPREDRVALSATTYEAPHRPFD